MTALQQDVLRLDVAVNDAFRMRVAEGIGHFTGNAHGVVDWQLLFACEPIAQRLTIHEWHHVKQEAVYVAGIVQRQDVRMLQAGRGLDLGEKSFGAKRRREIGVQHLERHLAAVPEIAREIHGGHATRANFTLDVVSLGKARAESGNDVGHDEAVITEQASRGQPSRRCRVQGHTERSCDLEHRCETRISFGAQRLVHTLSTHARFGTRLLPRRGLGHRRGLGRNGLLRAVPGSRMALSMSR